MAAIIIAISFLAAANLAEAVLMSRTLSSFRSEMSSFFARMEEASRKAGDAGRGEPTAKRPEGGGRGAPGRSRARDGERASGVKKQEAEEEMPRAGRSARKEGSRGFGRT